MAEAPPVPRLACAEPADRRPSGVDLGWYKGPLDVLRTNQAPVGVFIADENLSDGEMITLARL